MAITWRTSIELRISDFREMLNAFDYTVSNGSVDECWAELKEINAKIYEITAILKKEREA